MVEISTIMQGLINPAAIPPPPGFPAVVLTEPALYFWADVTGSFQEYKFRFDPL